MIVFSDRFRWASILTDNDFKPFDIVCFSHFSGNCAFSGCGCCLGVFFLLVPCTESVFLRRVFAAESSCCRAHFLPWLERQSFRSPGCGDGWIFYVGPHHQLYACITGSHLACCPHFSRRSLKRPNRSIRRPMFGLSTFFLFFEFVASSVMVSDCFI